jgi:ketosteroid isomerase-like protein
MPMPTPQQTVEAYLQAIAERDLEQARKYLADYRFRYFSPIGSFDDADRLIESLFGVPPILEQLTLRKCLSEGEEVVGILDVRVTMQNYATHAIAFWCRVQDGRIRSMEVIFDASEYRRMFANQFRTESRD